jgi:hypothetical protein
MASRPSIHPSTHPSVRRWPSADRSRLRQAARRRAGAVASLLVAGFLSVFMGPAADAPAAAAPGISGEACEQGEGVTVVVDFGALAGGVVVGCAPGTQPSGFAALGAAGFAVGFEGGPGMVCTIDGRPGEGYPFCWSTGGYWSYWKKARGGAWDFSRTGGASGPLAVDSVEGWSWAGDFDSTPPAGDETSAPPVTTTTVTTTTVTTTTATTTTATTTTEPVPTSAAPASTTAPAPGPSTTVPGSPTPPVAPSPDPGAPVPAATPVRPTGSARGAALARTGTDPVGQVLAGTTLVAVGLALLGRSRRVVAGGT